MRGIARWAASISLLALGWVLPSAAYAEVDHTAWDVLLKRHVVSGLVDYEGFRQDRDELERYVVSLQHAEPLQLGSREAQLAFWINAYNANVVKGVLDHHPIASVKDVKGFFDRLRYRIAGRELTLNEIEGEGRVFGDWRIHFAVVCASSSCPLLRAEAYVPERLETQLADQTTQFLADPRRGLRVEGRTLRLSKIFDWYTTDFIPAGQLGWLGRLTPEKLLPRIEPYLDRQTAQVIRSERLSVSFLDYDWSLNAQPR